MTPPRPSARRKLAVATWRAPKEGRLHARLAVDASALVAYCTRKREESGVKVTPGVVVGMAFHRGVLEVPAFHTRVVFGRIVPFTSYEVSFTVDIESGVDLAPAKIDVAGKSVVDVARELAAGAARLRAGRDKDFETMSGIVNAVPWWALRPLLSGSSLLHAGIGVRVFGLPAHPLGSMMVSNIGSIGLDEAYIAPVPLARVPLYVCVGAVSDAPMAVDGQVVVRPQLVLTATADHRLVDGVQAAALARVVRTLLADPDRLDRPAS
ncbi:MAG: 2-oxo acid dehydrogenase subunit E2 [Mycobacteriales bacterium]